MEESVNKVFLGLETDSHLKWKTTDHIITKQCAACYVVMSVVHISNTRMLKTTDFAYFHSIMHHGIILVSNSSCSKKKSLYKRKLLELRFV
jgi:hypothetical protein